MGLVSKVKTFFDVKQSKITERKPFSLTRKSTLLIPSKLFTFCFIIFSDSPYSWTMDRQ